jgi:hypothetical protein
MYEIYIKGPILAQNFVFLRMASSLSENTKLASALKMRHFLHYQDSRDNKPITGPNTPTLCDLYGIDFFFTDKYISPWNVAKLLIVSRSSTKNKNIRTNLKMWQNFNWEYSIFLKTLWLILEFWNKINPRFCCYGVFTAVWICAFSFISNRQPWVVPYYSILFLLMCKTRYKNKLLKEHSRFIRRNKTVISLKETLGGK